MHRTTEILIVAAGAALVSLPGRGAAQDAGELSVAAARARFGVHRRPDRPRHALTVRGRFPSSEALRDFDPAVDGLQVTVGEVTVLSVPAATDPDGYRFHMRRQETRRWRYRVRGEPGTVGLRTFTANTRTTRFRLVIKGADLGSVRDAGASDESVSVTVGDAAAQTGFSFQVTRRRNPETWHYRATPPRPPPVGPLAFTSLVAFSLPDTPRPHVEIARNEQEFTAMWATLGVPGPQPQVDFPQDMVVVVSSLFQGPGESPPILDIVAVRYRGLMEIDWRLAICEEPVCPGAPIPCPTATPFHVFTTKQYAGEVRTAQQATVAVCP